MTSLVAMQPTFLAWAGYFDLLDQADQFVYLDSVQFARRSWQQRNRIKTADGFAWLSLPVVASRRAGTTVADAKIGSVDVVRKWRMTLSRSYARARHAREELGWIDGWLGSLREGDSLSDRNIEFIETVCRRFGIDTPRCRARDLGCLDGRVERLISLCRMFGADTYLSPPGSALYLEPERELFDQAGIALMFQNYGHPAYPQPHGPFLSHASIVDLILNEGENAPAVFRSGQRPPVPADTFFASELFASLKVTDHDAQPTD